MSVRGWVPALVLIVRLAAGIPLIWAGVLKVADFGAWREQIRALELLPEALAGPAAAALPGLEIVFGAALVLGFWWRAAMVGAASLYLLFAFVLGSMLARGVAEGCGCFGPAASRETDVPAVALRAALALALAAAAFAAAPGPSVDALLTRSHIRH